MYSKELKRNLYKDDLTYYFYYMIRLVYLPFVVVAFSRCQDFSQMKLNFKGKLYS